MEAAISSGCISEKRLQDSIYRILGTNAAIGLHTLQSQGMLVPPVDALNIIGCPLHRKWAVEASDSAITLVKDVRNDLPIRPETHKHLFVNFLGNATTKNIMGAGISTGGNISVKDVIHQELEAVGFDVEMFEDRGFRTPKGSKADFKSRYDAALVFADFSGFATQNAVRLNWGSPMSNGCLWYAPLIPTAFISLNYTNHLVDVPRVPIYINAYNDKDYTIALLIKSSWVTHLSEDITPKMFGAENGILTFRS